MDLSEVRHLEALRGAVARGLGAFGVPHPVSLPEWAESHFYLSAESSYVEGRWRAWPFQRGLMAILSNDDIEEFDFRKSARLGYTKILLAYIGYNAHHRRRNQALWQPTDDDASEFVKTEFDPMLRDVPCMADVFPMFLRRDKDNTLELKKFLGSMAHIRGGKAAKNYRRISVDVALLDEIDAFDANVEKEGSPVKLAAKRVEGATFPKLVIGGTPKLKGFSLVEAREAEADIFLRYHTPCPHCGDYHPLTFGGKDETHGFKWQARDPDTVRHLCPHCGALITQAEWLAVAEQGAGRWQADDGRWMNDRAEFFDADGTRLSAPRHIAAHAWTALSPAVAWSAIVREFLGAIEKAETGKREDLIAFSNTTLGETYAEDLETTDAADLRARAEPYALGAVPRDCLLLLVGGDTQDNRIELDVWGYGRGGRMWIIDTHVVWGSPNDDATWKEVEQYLFDTRFRNPWGIEMKIEAAAIDSAGHHTHDVYDFARRHARKGIFAIKGYSGKERHIKQGAVKVDIDRKGRKVRNGVTLWYVGTNLAKDRLHARLQVAQPGPGYIHFSDELSDEWFAQFAGEARAVRKVAGGDESRWTPLRRRVEKWDCATYAVWLETHLELDKKSDAWWKKLEEFLQPATADLFAAPASESSARPPAASPSATPAVRPATPPAPAVARGLGRGISLAHSKRHA